MANDIHLYFEFLKTHTPEIFKGRTGMIQHQFANESDAEDFVNLLSSLSCFKKYLQHFEIKLENGRYVVRLSHAHLMAMANHSNLSYLLTDRINRWGMSPSNFLPNLTLTPIELVVEKNYAEPFYSKTITGFASISAWSDVTHGAVLLRDKKYKATLRDPGQLPIKPFRVRLNPYSKKYEAHDARKPSESLHQKAKAERPKESGTPYPPHQSFTYYNPKNRFFRPTYFSPPNLTPAMEEEIIGIRVSTQGTVYNRLILTDKGTRSVFYGFRTKKEAEIYAHFLETKLNWAKTLLGIEFCTRGNSYNEVMLRANWICDGTSQLMIYPPHDSLAGRYHAQLYALDLERYLKKYKDIYQHPPFVWHEDYKVPISFWSNGTPNLGGLYDLSAQQADLAREPETVRELFLRAAINYLQDSEISESMSNELTACFKGSHNIATIIDDFSLLKFISADLVPFYRLFLDSLTDNDVQALIQPLKQELPLESSQIQRIIPILLAIFEKKPHLLEIDFATDVILQLISMNEPNLLRSFLKNIQEKDRGILLISVLKLSGALDASKKGHAEIVEILIELTQQLIKENPQDPSINIILNLLLLGGKKASGPANLFRVAASLKQNEILKMLIDLACQVRERNRADNTLSKMLLAGNIEDGDAIALRMAIQMDHRETVKILIDAALKLKKENPNDTTLSKMLLTTHPADLSYVAYKEATERGHGEIVEMLIDAAVQLKAIDPADMTLDKMLLQANIFDTKSFAKILNKLDINTRIKVTTPLIEAAIKLKNPQILQSMMASLCDGETPLNTILKIFEKEDHEEIKLTKLLIHIAVSLKKIDHSDPTIKQMLLSPLAKQYGAASIAGVANMKKHYDVIEYIRDAAIKLREDRLIDEPTLNHILLSALHTGKTVVEGFQSACAFQDIDLIKNMLKLAIEIKYSDSYDTTLDMMLKSVSDIGKDNKSKPCFACLSTLWNENSEVFFVFLLKLSPDTRKIILTGCKEFLTESTKEAAIEILSANLSDKDISKINKSYKQSLGFFNKSLTPKVAQQAELLSWFKAQAKADISGKEMQALLNNRSSQN